MIQTARVTKARPRDRMKTASSKVKLLGQVTIVVMALEILNTDWQIYVTTWKNTFNIFHKYCQHQSQSSWPGYIVLALEIIDTIQILVTSFTNNASSKVKLLGQDTSVFFLSILNTISL